MRGNIFLAGLLSVGLTTACDACDGEPAGTQLTNCLATGNIKAIYPESPDYSDAAEPFNLRLKYKPAVIAVPSSTNQVSQAVLCAKENGYKVWI
jgi:hypothetical protein